MSQPDSSNELRLGILSYINVYTVMLGLSLLAILVAIGLLAIELTRYDWDTDAKTAQVGATGQMSWLAESAPLSRRG